MLSLQFFVTHRKKTNRAPVTSVWLLGTQLCSRSSHEWGANTRYHKAWVKRLGGVWSHCCSRIGFPVGASQVHPSKWHPLSKRRFWCSGLWLPNIHTTPKKKNWLYVPNTHTHTWIYTCVHVHIYITHTLHSHPHAHTHTWIYTQVHIHTYITHTLHTVTRDYTHMCIYINTPHTLYPHTHTHTHTCTYAYIHHNTLHSHTHTHTHTCAGKHMIYLIPYSLFVTLITARMLHEGHKAALWSSLLCELWCVTSQSCRNPVV